MSPCITQPHLCTVALSPALEPAPSPAVAPPRALGARSLRSSAPALALLALGCASEGVDLGGGVASQGLQRGARCEGSAILEGSVRVASQPELEALEGCEQIRGHLTVQRFAGADLAPLHALRAVEGGLLLGDSGFSALSEEQQADAELVDRVLAEEEALRGTWLASLAGLESLERVGALALRDTAISDVDLLAGLRLIGGMSEREAVLASSALSLVRNTALRDLTGLRQAQGLDRLELFGNGLESLDGLLLDAELARVGIFEEPALTDIRALEGVTVLGTLVIDGTGLADLDALTSLQRVDDELAIQNNPALLDASGLESLRQARSFNLENNASLRAAPSFQSYFSPPEVILIHDNPELEELSIDLPEATTNGIAVSGGVVPSSIDGVLIRNNAKLRSVEFPPSPIEPLGLSAIQVLAFEDNPSLTRIDFGELSRVDLLAIDRNPALAEVTLGDLATVDTLRITDNPALDPGLFDPVRTFERELSGNAAAGAP